MESVQQFAQGLETEPSPKMTMVEGVPAACMYLPGREARTRAFWTEKMGADEYQALMDAGFRRSGHVVYQPVCTDCRECVPLRVETARFAASKSQRRCLRRNVDVTTSVGPPVPTREKFELYTRYQREWHGRDGGTGQAIDAGAFVDFLYDSPVETREFAYRDPAGKLLAVGICDIGPTWTSSVYFYFDPAESRRGMGTYGAVREIAWAREQDMKYWYAGYWINGCGKMRYKADFRPHEILGSDGVWRAGEAQ